MEVHLEQQQESGFLAMGITKLHCDQSPEIPIQPHEPFSSLQAQHYNNHPKHSSLPTQPGGSTPPSPQHWAPRAHPAAQAGSVTAPTRGQKHQPQGQQRCLHTRLNHEVLAAAFHYFQGKVVLLSAEHNGRSLLLKQLINTQFWGGAGPLLQLQHLHLTSQHSDLQVLVRCLRSQQLHYELLESITLKLRNLHGKSVGLNTEYPLTRGWNCPAFRAVFYFSLEATPGSTHTLPDGKQSKYSFSHFRNISMKNRNSKYLIKSVMQKGSAMPTL